MRDFPSSPVRISSGQLGLLIADLKPLVCGSLTVQLNSMSLVDLLNFTGERRSRQVEFERQQQQPHDALIEFWRQLNAIAQRGDQRRHRVRLNLFEARVCATALRLGRRRRRPDPASSVPNTPEMNSSRLRLLRRLENLGRQLQRRFRAEAGNSVCAEFKQSLVDFRDAIFARLFNRTPSWVHPTSMRKAYVVIVDEACRLACEGLSVMGVTDIESQQVRRLIRRFLAYRRRGRISFSIRDLSDKSSFTKLRLANFILESRAKQDRKRETNNDNRRSNAKALSVLRDAA